MNIFASKVTKFLTTAMLIILTLNAYVQAEELPENVRIGLAYGDSAVSYAEIAVKGIKIGYDSSGFIELFRDDNISSAAISTVGTGFYKVGGDFAHYREAEQEAKNFIDAYVAYTEHGYQVWSKNGTGEVCVSSNATKIVTDNIRFIFAVTGKNLVVEPINDTVEISLNNKRYSYRGWLEFKRVSDKMNIINLVNLSEYLYAVLPKEMPSSWNIEAQKAQAICARNYTITSIDRHKADGFNICTETHCQVYGGAAAETANSIRAVNETANEIAKYDGNPAQLYYFATSGGQTEAAKNVWGSDIPYLRGVNDPYEDQNTASNATWRVEMTASEIESALSARGINIGTITNIQILERTPTNRVLKLRLVGTKGAHILERESARLYFGWGKLLSQNFEVYSKNNQTKESTVEIYEGGLTAHSVEEKVEEYGMPGGFMSGIFLLGARNQNADVIYTGDNFLFVGKGYGHGVGMSQYGANGMAENGFSYIDIIYHYFPGVIIE